MTQSPRDTSKRAPRSEPQPSPILPKVKLATRSMTAEHLIVSLKKVYDLDTAALERIIAAGMVLRVRDVLLRDIDHVLGEFGTSMARFMVLAVICHEGGGLQLSEIAAQAAVHPTTLTATIDRLERDGLIERRPNPSDRRGTFAVGTAKGHALYRQARAAMSAAEYGLAEVDSATIKRLIKDLDKVAVEIERRVADR